MKNNKKTYFTMLCAAVLLTLSMTACGQNTGSVTEPKQDSGVQETAEPKQDDGKRPNLMDPAAMESAQDAEQGASEQTLAKRLCGKYATRDHDEWMGMDIVSFGDNIYAYVGLDMEEEGEGEPEEFDYYSFWAYEFYPEDAAKLQSTTESSVEVFRQSFSVMSNAGKHQGAPVKGTIELTDEGIVLDGFDEGRVELTRDERAEDMFSYAANAKDGAADADLQGYWRSSGTDKEYYLDFDGSALYIFSKTPGEVVSFAGGGITAGNGKLEGQFTSLGSGGMPLELEASYRIEGSMLSVKSENNSDFDIFNDGADFERIDAEEGPLLCADYALSYVPGQTDVSALLESDPMQDPFYGIFVSAQTESAPAIEFSEKVLAKGFDSMVIYSPEWENLSPKKLFCVTAGRYATQQEADDNLPAVKAEYPDAYVKYSGACKGTHVTYTNYGMGIISVEDNYVILQNMDNEPTYQWSRDVDLNGSERLDKIWIVDKDTVFDPSCETEFFNNYRDGDTPLTWFKHNDELLKTNAEEYALYGPAFSGVFEIVVTGNHVDAFLGSYWWD